mgnify:CR=1 FL=1
MNSKWNQNKDSDESSIDSDFEKPANPNFNVDQLISQLLSPKVRNAGILNDLSEGTIIELIDRARDIFTAQPVFLELTAPVKIVSDIHGQYKDLLRFLDLARHPPYSNYLFLGDYVDRGKQSIESICLLFAYKIKYPESVFLLRGNHECENITKIYGFYEECQKRYNISLWKKFVSAFNMLPVAALIDDKILCMHGGLSKDMNNLDEIKCIQRPAKIPETGILCDLLWSDPSPLSSPELFNIKKNEWGDNDRGVSFIFSENVVKRLVDKYKIDLIVRGHQVMEDGYQFFADRKLITIFSAPCYCGEFDNNAAMLSVDENMKCDLL